jgi:two-component system response regulator DesR
LSTTSRIEPAETPTRPIRVLCVDDSFLVREAIRFQLTNDRGFDWLGGLACADGLVNEARRLRPDVVLLDIDMPGLNAFQALHALADACPDVRVLVVSGHVQAALIDRAVNLGAWGYFSKNEPAALAEAVRRIARGEFVLGAEVGAAYGLSAEAPPAAPGRSIGAGPPRSAHQILKEEVEQ